MCITTKYLKGGLGYGGPCFPRDNLAFAHLSRQLGTQPTLAEATNQFNHQHLDHLIDLVLSQLPAQGKVGVLGLSYKPNTYVIEESAGVALVQGLLSKGVSVIAYDPMAMENARTVVTSPQVTFATSIRECTTQADVVVITTPWEEFKGLTPTLLKSSANFRPTLIDGWRILNRSQFETVANYIALGVCQE